MIDPQSLKLSALPWVPLNATAGFPQQPAIYFAIDANDVVQYIGQSGNVRKRWKQHNRYEELNDIGGIRIAYLFMESRALLDEVERALVQWFDPPLNVLLKKVEEVPRFTVSRKKPGASRRTFNISDDLYIKLQKVAYRERLNATQQLERSLDKFFADYEATHKIKVDEIAIPTEDDN